VTPGLYVEWLVEPMAFDLAEFGQTAVERGTDGGFVVVREELEYLSHDGSGHVFARFVGRDDEDEVRMDDALLPCWRTVAE
jgi:hypothetical protein